MPRRKIGVRSARPAAKRRLAEALAAELRDATKQFGQPMIYEQDYASGKVRVVVVWDEWADDPLEAADVRPLAEPDREAVALAEAGRAEDAPAGRRLEGAARPGAQGRRDPVFP